MKSYPVTMEELTTLAGVGIGVTISFSIAAAALSFYLNTEKDISFSTGIPEDQMSYWTAAKDFSLYGSILFAIIGLLLIIFGFLKVSRIIRSTKFDVQ